MFNCPRQGVMEPWEKAIQWKNIPIDMEEKRLEAEADEAFAEYRKLQAETEA
ncbi:hypothetical protein CYLTODRAFT_426916 [Cylindrobasidium torrendii FP15055 ss-10]|uniref:Uncharacterized protein n=1 Tax=Cylindrobasidium torrendii FP15055 ss-10 TaxID=1314674 RepID=A0A0D7AYU5_9AGAR|nr:hypothetical protein CYLTODRAFT_426916 [Cylindrobasidium torrendii FP15055 ss-10]